MSVNTSVRLPYTLKLALQRRADAEGRSLNNLMVALLTAGVEEKPAEQVIV